MTHVRHLNPAQLVRLAERACGGEALVRDLGLIESAAARPATALFGAEQFPHLLEKAAALMHSIARFHPLVDGNKRLAWLAAAAMCELNGAQVTATNDQAYEVTMAVASGKLDSVPEIAKALAPLVRLPQDAT
ncbi:MAG: type II toxin-antitoxin system death-on-curing family toxin [Micromonosporaceae bacterium]